MKIFEGTMILTDLDGTYLADDHHISAENRAAAEWFMENGGRFSIATGRSKAGMEHFFPELRINAPAILSPETRSTVLPSRNTTCRASVSMPGN